MLMLTLFRFAAAAIPGSLNLATWLRGALAEHA